MARYTADTNTRYWVNTIDAYEISSSIETNKSIVRVDYWFGRKTSSSYMQNLEINYSITVGGNTKTGYHKVQGYQTVGVGDATYLVGTIDFEVPHNSDGSMSVDVSASFTNDGSPVSGSVSNPPGQPLVLTTIARATKCPSLTGYVKSSYNLSLQPASGSFNHSLHVWFGSVKKWLQADGTLGDNEYLFSTRTPLITLPKDFYSQFNGPSATGTFTLKTYNGSQYVGEKEEIFYVQCNPSLCTPIATATVVDINEKTLLLTGDENDIIKFASQVLITPNIKVSDNDDTNSYITYKAINDNPFSTDTCVVVNPSDKNFKLTLTNSRNMTGNIIVSATGSLIDHVPLTFNISYLGRPEPTTGEISINYDGNYYDGAFTDETVTSSNLYVGNELSYSNIVCSFPDNLWETMGITTVQITVLETDGYRLYYWSQGELEPTDTSDITGRYAVILESKATIDQLVLYRATRYGTGEPIVDVNSHDLIVNESFGIIESINNSDTIVYPYITKTDVIEPIRNSIALSWKYREKGTDAWIDGGNLSPTVNTEKNTYRGNESLGLIFDYTKQYEFIIHYEDKVISKDTPIQPVSRGLPIYWWDSNSVHIIGNLYVDGEINPAN